MRKHIFLLGLAIVMTATTVLGVQAKNNAELKDVIKMYKAGNYSACIQQLEPILAQDPSNAAAHYYMALASAQAGRVDDAVSHYETVITLNSSPTLVKYATRGKLCIEDFEKCSAADSLDTFINSKRGFDITNSVQNSIESQGLDSLRRDINDNKEIDAKRLKRFRKFSMNTNESMPTNDEIVAALRVLQEAGFATPVASPVYGDLAALYGPSSSMNQGAMDNLFNMMSRYGATNNGSEKIDSRLLQTMMTSQMMGF